MQSFVLVGQVSDRESYIQTVIAGNSIASYSITRLEDSIKIADIHEILKKMRIQAAQNEKRLVIFSGTLTIPAQNALLKFLEELADSDIVIFAVDTKDELLDTIISRCQIVMLHSQEEQKERTSELQWDALFFQDTQFEKKLLEVAQAIQTREQFEEFLLSLRRNIIDQVMSKNNTKVYSAVLLLTYLHRQYQYIKENNLNPKFTIESASIHNSQTLM